MIDEKGKRNAFRKELNAEKMEVQKKDTKAKIELLAEGKVGGQQEKEQLI